MASAKFIQQTADYLGLVEVFYALALRALVYASLG